MHWATRPCINRRVISGLETKSMIRPTKDGKSYELTDKAKECFADG